MSLSPGDRLGHYCIVSALGAGGMGEVYRARDEDLERDVAIKVLPDAVAHDTEKLQRFEREARALAALNHPNVATLYGLEREGEVPFLAMELVEGPTLAERIGQGALSWREAAEIFLQIARGLEAAHERGIVHRDLKPANVKLGVADTTGDARVKILDFGLARAMAEGGAGGGSGDGTSPDPAHSPTLTLGATLRGEILGTAGYMAPEQARGAAVDKRADVWAFGVCLFEALTARHGFGGDTVSDRLASVLKEEPEWEALPAGLPPRLEGLLRRCLEKRASERLRDIGEARILLRRALDEPEVEADTAAATEDSGGRVNRRRAVAWAAAAALGAAALTGLLITLLGARRPSAGENRPEPVRFAVGDADGEPIAGINDILISPDGRRLVFTTRGEENRLFVRELDRFDGEIHELEPARGALFPFLSPDGEWVGYFRGVGGSRTLHKTRLADGATLAITDEPRGGYRGSWAEDGTIYTGNQRGRLGRVLLGARSVENLIKLGSLGGEIAHLHPEVLPGGRGVVFTALQASDAQRIAVWDAETGEVKPLIEGGGEARYVGAGNGRAEDGTSGHLVFVERGSLQVVGFDLDRLEVVGTPIPVLDGVRTGTVSEGAFSLSRDGSLAFVRGEAASRRTLRLAWMRADGTLDEVVATGDFSQPSISPDGRRFVVQRGEDVLHVYERGNPLPIRVLGNLPNLSDATWLGPSEIVYGAGATSGQRQLVRVPAEGLGEAKPLGVPLDVTQAGLSHDDRELIFGSQWNIFAARLDAPTEVRPVIESDDLERDPRLSPDGRLLAYFSNRFGGWTLFVTPYPTLDRHLPIRNSRSAFSYNWGPDDRLYYSMSGGPIAVATLRAEPELMITDTEELAVGSRLFKSRGFAIGADGRLLAIARDDDDTTDDEPEANSARIQVALHWLDAELENLGAQLPR